LSGSDISLIDLEKFRCYCLLSRSVGFSFCYHCGCLCIWMVLVGCFVTVPGLEWSNYNWREDRFQLTEKTAIDLHMQDYGAVLPDISINLRHPAGLCADVICGDSGYLRTTFHLHFPTFLHSICAAETLNH